MINKSVPTKYYSILSVIQETEVGSVWNFEAWQKIQRKIYIDSLINHEPLNTCPECGNKIKYTEDEDEYYCTACGLVTSTSVEYVAGKKITLPHGRR